MKKTVMLVMLAASFGVITSFSSCKGKPKDADIKAAIETALKADPMAAGTMVSVEKGVATLTGECKDEMCRNHCADLVKGIKGVKEVVNNCSVAPVTVPEPAVINPEDEVLAKSLADAMKDAQGVTGSVKDGKIVLSGEIAKAKWTALKQLLDKLKSKGYDLTGLTIK